MSIDDAVDLFVDRAATASGFVMTTENKPAVVDLCTRLDGLPLAIELAAGRSRAFPVQQLAARLDDRFRLLTGGARTALPRQQTLRAVVEWSYELLFEQEQKVFDRLSVFSGGCTLDAAEAVCAGDDIDPYDIADILGHLVDKSLVIADQSSGEVRFRLLQTLALFGRERLASSSDAHATRARHASQLATLCARGPAAFRGDAQEIWLAEVEREADNLHVALTWVMDQGDARAAQTMLGGLGWSWWFAGRGDEGWRWISAGLECAGATTPEARASAAIWASYVGASAGIGGGQVLTYGWEALELARLGDDNEFLAMTLRLLGEVVATSGDPATGLTLLEEAATLTAHRTDPWGRATHAETAGRCAELRGDLGAAEPLLRESLDLYEQIGVEWAVAIVGGHVAMIAERQGDIDAAIEFTERARRAAVRLRLNGYDAMMLARLGDYALWKGDRPGADEFHRRAIELAEEVRYPNAKAVALAGQAVAHRQAGELDAAERAATAALALLRSSGLWNGVPKMLATLGLIAEQRGELEDARALQHRALRASASASDGRAAALALEGLASLALVGSDADLAARLLGGAAEQRRTRGGRASGPVSDVERITTQAKAALGESAFDTAFAAGAATPLTELVAD